MGKKSVANAQYPTNWNKIATDVKERCNWKCERCGHAHDPESGYCLTVHHLNMDPACCEDWNLAVLCQRCHLSIQGRVVFCQQYMLEHSEWMKPHVEGFKKWTGERE